MNLSAIITSNGFGMLLIIILLCSGRKRYSQCETDEKLFMVLQVSLFALCFFEMCSFIADGLHPIGSVALNRFCNSMLYVLGMMPPSLWYAYVYYKIYDDEAMLKRVLPWIFIPVAVMAVLGTLNYFVDIFYTILPGNVYQRLPLFWVSVAGVIAYLLAATVLLMHNQRRVKRYIIFPMLSFLILPLIGMLIQLLVYGTSLSWSLSAVSTVIVSINIQKEATGIDRLTGVYSRPRLDDYLKRECGRKADNLHIVGFMLDIDRFKMINDTYGHAVGDSALINVGRFLRAVVRKGDFLARYGGDEFIIVAKFHDLNNIPGYRARIHRSAEHFNTYSDEPYKISFSIGCAVLHEVENDSVDLFLSRMDAAMYEEKQDKRAEPCDV